MKKNSALLTRLVMHNQLSFINSLCFLSLDSIIIGCVHCPLASDTWLPWESRVRTVFITQLSNRGTFRGVQTHATTENSENFLHNEVIAWTVTFWATAFSAIMKFRQSQLFLFLVIWLEWAPWCRGKTWQWLYCSYTTKLALNNNLSYQRQLSSEFLRSVTYPTCSELIIVFSYQSVLFARATHCRLRFIQL